MELDLIRIAGVIVFLLISNVLAYLWYNSKWWNDQYRRDNRG